MSDALLEEPTYTAYQSVIGLALTLRRLQKGFDNGRWFEWFEVPFLEYDWDGKHGGCSWREWRGGTVGRL